MSSVDFGAAKKIRLSMQQRKWFPLSYLRLLDYFCPRGTIRRIARESSRPIERPAGQGKIDRSIEGEFWYTRTVIGLVDASRWPNLILRVRRTYQLHRSILLFLAWARQIANRLFFLIERVALTLVIRAYSPVRIKFFSARLLLIAASYTLRKIIKYEKEK